MYKKNFELLLRGTEFSKIIFEEIWDSLSSSERIYLMMNFNNKADSQYYHNNIHLHIESAENHTQVNKLCQYFETTENLKIHLIVGQGRKAW